MSLQFFCFQMGQLLMAKCLINFFAPLFIASFFLSFFTWHQSLFIFLLKLPSKRLNLPFKLFLSLADYFSHF